MTRGRIWTTIGLALVVVVVGHLHFVSSMSTLASRLPLFRDRLRTLAANPAWQWRPAAAAAAAAAGGSSLSLNHRHGARPPLTSRPLGSPQPPHEAAVVVLLGKFQRKDSIIFTVRSFVGGHRDPEDRDLIDTAQREEEIGLTPDQYDLLLPPMAPVPNYDQTRLVHPFIGVLKDEHFDLDTLRPQESEVSAIFVVSIEELQRGKTLVASTRFGFPMYEFHGGPVKIWGLTSFILEQALTHILDVERYTTPHL